MNPRLLLPRMPMAIGRDRGIVCLIVAIMVVLLVGCSFSLLPKGSTAPTACEQVDQADQQVNQRAAIIAKAKAIDIVADRAPKCPAPYEMCLDAVNATKLRAKLKLLTQ